MKLGLIFGTKIEFKSCSSCLRIESKTRIDILGEKKNWKKKTKGYLANPNDSNPNYLKPSQNFKIQTKVFIKKRIEPTTKFSILFMCGIGVATKITTIYCLEPKLDVLNKKSKELPNIHM